MAKFQHGFKAQANRIAQGLRKQMGLSGTDPLDPRDVFPIFSISALALSDFQEACPEEASVLLSRSGGFSAILLSVGGVRRVVIHNDSHRPGRQSSNLAHELGHVLLVHPPEIVCTGDLGRESDSLVEAEAAYLGGCLLVPNEAAHRLAALRVDVQSASLRYGVSEDMVRYRLRISGALRRSRRSA